MAIILPTGQWYAPSAAEVKFVHPVSPGGSVKFVASGVNFSIFTNFLCFFLLKLLKLGEIGGVKFLTWKSGGVKFWTNFMSGFIVLHNVHTYKIQLCVLSKNSTSFQPVAQAHTKVDSIRLY